MNTEVGKGRSWLFPLWQRLHLLEMFCNKLQKCYQKGVVLNRYALR